MPLTQINRWKKEFQEKAPALFEKESSAAANEADKDQLIQMLYAQIGGLKVANAFLKKIAIKPVCEPGAQKRRYKE